jgi:hypothetical protein
MSLSKETYTGQEIKSWVKMWDDTYLIKPTRAVLEQQGWLIPQIAGKLTFRTNLKLRSDKVHPCSSNYRSNPEMEQI